jgi:NAD(P)-dependent dehydrogenase (short-subunit alcohol dehydrogenase family)
VVKNWVAKCYGTIDCIINAAAINDKVEGSSGETVEGQFEEFMLQDWQMSINVGVTGAFLVCQTLLPLMCGADGGAIINICSTYGIVAPRQDVYIDDNGVRIKYKNPAYPTVKGAILNFTRYLAAYLGERRIRVNSISPGGVENGQSIGFIKKYSSNTLLGRMAEVSDYDGILIYLCSNESRYATGANFVVDGGYTAI